MKWWQWTLGGVGLLFLASQGNRIRVMSNLNDIKLGANFSLGEFVVTNTGLDNIPNDEEVARLQLLVQYILQPLRTYLGIPITINSGFRSELVNNKVGGVKTSQHRLGEAADIVINGLTNQQIIDAIRALKLPYDELIDEQLWKFDPLSGWRLAKWVHVSFTAKRQPQLQWMTARNTKENTKTIYSTVKFGLAA